MKTLTRGAAAAELPCVRVTLLAEAAGMMPMTASAVPTLAPRVPAAPPVSSAMRAVEEKAAAEPLARVTVKVTVELPPEEATAEKASPPGTRPKPLPPKYLRRAELRRTRWS